MKKVLKATLSTVVYLLYTAHCHAQWTAEDSLKLKQILNSTEEMVREEPSIYKDYLQFDTTLPEFPSPVDNNSISQRGMTLMPYNGATKYNYDPVYRKRVRFGTEIKRNANDLFPTFNGKAMGMMNAPRIMMMGGTFGNFSANVTGSTEAEKKIQSILSEYELLKKGLLYFKYTADGKGNFTLYLPNDRYMKGTFTRNWLGYRLHYNDMEFVVSFSQIGGKFYKLNLNLTQEFKQLFASENVEKVILVTTVSRIAAGTDKKQ